MIKAEVALYGSLPLLNTTSAVTVFGRLAVDQTMPFRWREYYKVIEGDRRDVEHYTPHELALRITRLPFNVRLNRQVPPLLSELLMHEVGLRDVDVRDCLHKVVNRCLLGSALCPIPNDFETGRHFGFYDFSDLIDQPVKPVPCIQWGTSVRSTC